jgi:hypothetical protein
MVQGSLLFGQMVQQTRLHNKKLHVKHAYKTTEHNKNQPKTALLTAALVLVAAARGAREAACGCE